MGLAITGNSVLFILALAWTLVWKGIALWKSARQVQKAWFIVMLVLNTLGILPIIYLIWFQKEGAWIKTMPVRRMKAVKSSAKPGKKSSKRKTKKSKAKKKKSKKKKR